MLIPEARMGKMVGIAEFKAKCERLLVQMEQDGEPIQLTRRGKVVGVISPPAPPAAPVPLPSAFGMLKSDAYRDVEPEDFVVDPNWEAEWDANNPAELYTVQRDRHGQ